MKKYMIHDEKRRSTYFSTASEEEAIVNAKEAQSNLWVVTKEDNSKDESYHPSVALIFNYETGEKIPLKVKEYKLWEILRIADEEKITKPIRFLCTKNSGVYTLYESGFYCPHGTTPSFNQEYMTRAWTLIED